MLKNSLSTNILCRLTHQLHQWCNMQRKCVHMCKWVFVIMVEVNQCVRHIFLPSCQDNILAVIFSVHHWLCTVLSPPQNVLCLLLYCIIILTDWLSCWEVEVAVEMSIARERSNICGCDTTVREVGTSTAMFAGTKPGDFNETLGLVFFVLNYKLIWFRVLKTPSLCSSGLWESNNKYWSACVGFLFTSLLKILLQCVLDV